MRLNALKLTVLVLAASLPLQGTRAFAAGTSSAAFLQIGWGARAAAMGEAVTAASDDVDGIYWNPAGLNGVKRLQEGFTHNSWLDGMNFESAAFAVRRDTVSVIGAGIGYLNTGDIERADKYGNASGYYSSSDMALLFSYARVLKPRLSAGATFKIISERIEAASARSFALDAGALYDYKPGLRLGASLRNLGTGITLAKTPGPLPLGLRVGAAYQLKKDLLLTSDINMAFDDSLSLHFGGEYLYPSLVRGLRLTLRAGIKTSAMSYLGALSALSLGFGAEKGSLGIDYAMTPYGELGLTHRLSLKLKFDAASSEKSTDIMVEKDGIKVKRSAEDVYRETMQWFSEKAVTEKLNAREQADLLGKIVDKFGPFGVDVSAAKARLDRIKNGGK